jgi:putative DNA methylase
MTTRTKLIEVALPLDAINKASAREKSIRHGHPSTLHLWWARRPLAAARAVIFAQMVDDPSTYVDVLRADPKLRRKAESALTARMKLRKEARALAKKAEGTGLSVPEPGPAPTLDDILADQERQRLFRIIEDLVLWENTTNETVVKAARDEIWQSWRRACAENADHPRAMELFDRNRLPAFHDPFAGGGALPLEAQRLGLESYASDLNPVAVLINKAMIDIPPRFAGKPPVNPESRKEKSLIDRGWKGAQGLAKDVRYYGQWMRDEAENRIGHLYPKVEVTDEMVKARPDLKQYAGKKLTVITWLWARTVKSPNPAFAQVEVPLAGTFMLSTKPGREAFVDPVIDGDVYRLTVKVGKPKNAEITDRGTRAGKAQDFLCLISGVPIPRDYIRDEGKAGRLGARLMALVAEGTKGRAYLSPTVSDETMARNAATDVLVQESRATFLAGSTPTRAMITGGVCSAYGLSTWGDLFTDRQLLALATFSNLVHETRERVKTDAISAGLSNDEKSLESGGTHATAYADAVAAYLSFAVSKAVDRNTSLCFWERPMDRLRGTFGRQALPMVWDYAETNPFAGAGGDFYGTANSLCEVLDKFVLPVVPGVACQADAAAQTLSEGKVVSCDPPYYDNIGYADLSDFFYPWLRRSLKSIFPGIFTTVAVPKEGELVATPFRHGGRERAETFFLNGMTKAMHQLAEGTHPALPVTIYYAFKQSESSAAEGTASTGWDTFLDAVIRAGFAISGTWPLRTEQLAGLKGKINALASSIVLVCRPRAADAPIATRREFVTALKAELPNALAHLQRGNIAPVDLAQAAIGPGMAIYTRYAKVLDAEGKVLTVREALALINQTLDEALSRQEGDFDADSRWALTWYEQSGFDEGEYGVAEQLSKSKNTAIGGMVEAGILESKRGKVRLLRPEELPPNWDPAIDPRLTVWEVVHQLIRVLASGGEGAAAELVAKLGAKAEIARELAYRLYTLCERKKRAGEALAYNGLVQSWPEIVRLAREGGKPRAEQGELFGNTEE